MGYGMWWAGCEQNFNYMYVAKTVSLGKSDLLFRQNGACEINYLS